MTGRRRKWRRGGIAARKPRHDEGPGRRLGPTPVSSADKPGDPAWPAPYLNSGSGLTVSLLVETSLPSTVSVIL